MKATNQGKLIGTLLIAAAGALALPFSAPGVKAAGQPRVIEVRARKFEFMPSAITLKKGEPVILRLTSEDRTHGFLLKPLKIDTDIAAGKTTDIAVTPDAVGKYTVICDHYCGTGHGDMKMKISVVE